MIGKMIISMGLVSKNFLINVFIKEIMSMENHKELEDILGQMDSSMKDSGLMV